MQPWKTSLKAELLRGEAARQRGNEGQARVCARRAAGIAIREYLARQGRPAGSPSAMDALALLSHDPSASPEVKELIAHLGLRVDESFKLPEGVDLLSDAQRLCGLLLPGWETE